MFSLTEQTRVFLKPGITDGRLGAHGLIGLVGQMDGQDVFSGSLYIFCNKRRNRISCLVYPETVIILTHDKFRLRPDFCDSITPDNSWSGSHLTSTQGARVHQPLAPIWLAQETVQICAKIYPTSLASSSYSQTHND
jgi:transposase